MLVNDSGRFLSQRRLPKMALFSVRLEDEHVEVRYGDSVLRFGMHESGDLCEASVWRDTWMAREVSDEASAWFSEHLGVSARLLTMDPEHKRIVDPNFAPNETDQVAFADGYPLLIVNERSLADLNERLDEPISIDRFRGNIVYQGSEPFEEDNWKEITVGEVRFAVAKPCARCTMITVDQQTGQKGPEPIRTLTTYRKFDKQVFFGQNLVPLNRGKIRLGDPVTVVSKREEPHPYFLAN